MKSLNLLDCTLRDGGYVNNWTFGEKTIDMIIDSLIRSGGGGYLRIGIYER